MFHRIDGQQRLTTSSILLTAVRNAARQRGQGDLDRGNSPGLLSSSAQVSRAALPPASERAGPRQLRLDCGRELANLRDACPANSNFTESAIGSPQLSGSWSDHILNETGVRTFQHPLTRGADAVTTARYGYGAYDHIGGPRFVHAACRASARAIVTFCVWRKASRCWSRSRRQSASAHCPRVL